MRSGLVQFGLSHLLNRLLGQLPLSTPSLE